MTHGTKLALGIAVVAAVAFGIYSVTAPTKGDKETATSTPEGAGKKMAFADFARQKGTYQCTFKQTIQGVNAQGTIYMDKGLIRGEVTQTSTTTGTMNSSFIIRDGFVYYWNSLMAQGIKLKYDLDNYKAGDFSQFDQIGDYECKEWTADRTKFTIPTIIQFQEMN